MNKRTPKSGKADEPEQICVSKEWMPGNWKRLLVTCVLALACGIGGAWVYTALSGSSSSERGSKGSNQADKSSQAGEGNKKSDNQSGGKSAVGQGADSSQNSATVSKAAGLGSSEGAETATKDAWLDANLEHLSHRIDVLGKRLSKMTLPEQESPAVLHTLQMQMTDLENDFEQVAGLPAKIQQLERDVASFKEDLTVLKANLPREALSPNQNP